MIQDSELQKTANKRLFSIQPMMVQIYPLLKITKKVQMMIYMTQIIQKVAIAVQKNNKIQNLEQLNQHEEKTKKQTKKIRKK